MQSKTVVISGASAGIGAACAEVFAEHGYNLALGARRIDRLESLVPALKAKGAQKVFCAALDVTSASSVEDFTNSALQFFDNRIDVLLNNAGLALGVDPVVQGNPEGWEHMLDTNVMGLLRLTRALLPAMLSQNCGHIINMGSIASHFTYAGGAVYAATKHAVKAITGALKLELNGTAIRVSSIDPGMVETEFSLVRLGDTDKAKNVYQGMTPLTGRDIAECVFFAASRPAHVNIDQIIVMPTDQASIYKVHRRADEA